MNITVSDGDKVLAFIPLAVNPPEDRPQLMRLVSRLRTTEAGELLGPGDAAELSL